MKTLLFISFFLVFPVLTAAQFSGINTNLSLTAFPQFPEPFAEVEIGLNAASIDTTSASIRWTVDGVEQTTFQNQRTITVTMGPLGVNKNIGATITTKDGTSIPLSLTLTPSVINIIIEADTTVPVFYKGRALPTPDSKVRAIALPQLGNGQSTNNLSYSWRLNRAVLGGGAVRGQNSISFTMPSGNSNLLYVDVYNQIGQLVGQSAMTLPRVDPQIWFYENNPLKGIRPLAISDNFILIGEEVTLRAEPYFMNSDILSTNSLIEWDVNNRKIDNPSDNLQELTLKRQGGGGRFSIGFHIRNLSELLQGARESFTLQF